MKQCLICNTELDGSKGMPAHLKKHNISYFNYVLKFIYAGIRPVCKCGCKFETSFHKGKFRNFKAGHDKIKYKQIIINCATCGVEKRVAENTLGERRKTFHCSIDCRSKDSNWVKSFSTNRKDRISLETVKQRIFEIHGDECVMDDSTFVNMRIKCRFIDKDRGEFWNQPRNVCGSQKQSHPSRRMEKAAQTNLLKFGNKCALHGSNEQKVKDAIFKKFGVDSVSRSREVSLKQARGKNQRYILFNWKTNQEVICQSTNEVAVVEWLNQTKQEFDWHVKFDMPNGKVYFCDLYLPARDLFIEIKGQFYKDALEKWNWFHTEHLNSELWDEQKLKDLGLFDRVKELRREKRRQRRLNEKQQSEVIPCP